MTARSYTEKRVSGPLPIVMAVTGHRDLVPQDMPLIEKSLNSLFQSLREIYPYTPLRLLSPLAEGSDRVVAKIALKQGAELVVPLPMPEEEYRQDFEATASEFEELKQHASMVFTIPVPFEAEGDDISQYETARNVCYENIGKYVVKHAHLLIALWNGFPSAEQGGTAQTVKYCLHDFSDVISSAPVNANPSGVKAVWHLPVRRFKTPQETFPKDLRPYEPIWRFDSNPGQTEKFSPSSKAWPHKALSHLRSNDVFNKDALSLSSAATHKVLSWLLPQDIDRAHIDPSERVINVFAAADLVASKHQNSTYQLWKWIFILAGLMVVIFGTYSNVWSHASLLIVYPAVFVTLTVLYWITRKRRLHDRFIDARSLAEGLRVYIYWRMAGIRESVADVYLRRHVTVVGWVLRALRGLSTLPPPDSEFAEREGIHAADQYWVQGQLDYYDRQSARQTRLVKFHERLAGLLYALTLVFSVCVAVLGFVITIPTLTQEILILFMGLGPALAALWIAYADKQGWDKHVKEYRRTLGFFMLAHERIREKDEGGSSAGFRQVQEILLDLGKEALYENAEWAILHRHRPPTLPMG